MLKLLARPKRVSKATPSHEERFMQRYERLLIAARHLTGEPGRAEDLVHNAFVQFMLSRPDLASIKSLDGYLLIMLRNMNVSQARRPQLIQSETLSAADYDSAEAGLRALDAHAQLQIRQQLCLICEYACRRKDQSKIGSALILRYFHGYYPSEVAQVLRVNRHQVDHWLLLARQEARAYVEDPTSLKLIAEHSETTGTVSHIRGSTSEFLSTLRRDIFLARTGCCLMAKDLRQIYQATSLQNSTIEHTSHVVACMSCLDEVNGLLGIPLLAERFPMETFGNEPKQRGGPPSGDDGGAGGTGDREVEKLKQVSRRRLNDTLEHRPKELHVAVNGYLLGSHALSGESNQLALNVNLPERVGFVEVFSEQGFCLMFTGIDGPPDGPLVQKAHADLSDGRSLELNLNFGGLWPTINVAYLDPSFGSDSTSVCEETAKGNDQPSALPSGTSQAELQETAILHRIRRAPLGLAQALSNWSFWFRPGIATAVVALLALTAFLFLSVRRSPIVTFTTTAELLGRASAAEGAFLARTDQVLHRTISLEEKNSAGVLIARRKIEVWHNGDRGITARRLYDERGALVAGDWRRADGVQTIYLHGSRPQLLLKSEKQDAVSLTFENVWHLDPSAIQFASLIGHFDGATVETRASDYLITYSRSPASVQDGLLKATLTLSRADLHPIKQTMTIQQGKDIREYDFVEASFERHTPASVAPAVFDPDPELLVPAAVSAKPREAGGDTTASLSQPVTPVLATAEVEVEALQLLNQIGADLNDQTSVTRSPEGKLRIAGLVDSEQRKAEIVRALAPLSHNPAVIIEIQTVAEALRQQQRSQESSGPASVERVEVNRAEMPVYADLKKYFAATSGASTQANAENDDFIREFAARILNRSRRAMSHAGTLKRLAGRFSEDDLHNLTPEARVKWLTVIRSHAHAFEQETRMLRQELQPIFFFGGSIGDGSEAVDITDDASLAQAIQRLLEIGLANDEVIRSAFAVSSEGSNTTGIRSRRFWHSLGSAEALAAKISRSTPSR